MESQTDSNEHLNWSPLPCCRVDRTGQHMTIEDIAFKLETAGSTRTAAVIGIIAAVGGPIALIAFGGNLASNLPWFVWAIVSLVLLLVVGLGYYLFTRSHDSKDISINTNSREQRGGLSRDSA